ncbi:UNVERIFIED_ORG: hypothetical protein QE398_000187 [Atlantibacter sp. SORGH_AS 304]|nr:hypothetical protein [Atlantibacter sp. SORGH_AS_0304]
MVSRISKLIFYFTSSNYISFEALGSLEQDNPSGLGAY